MSRISTCPGCRAKEQGVKSRIAIKHTCGIEPKSERTKKTWLPDPAIEQDVDPLTDDVKLFYEIEEVETESVEPEISHKWGGWERKEVAVQLRMLGVSGKYERKCMVCGAIQHKTWYKNQAWPDLEIQRNGRSGVDCNPELKQSKK